MRINIKTFIGEYVGFVNAEGVYRLFLPNQTYLADDFERRYDQDHRSHLLIEKIKLLNEELSLYHMGELQTFTIPVSPFTEDASPFRIRVWQVMREIPYGETWNYGQLAKRAGSTSGRAIGGACSANPVPILIPCHRVISSNGTIGGFSGGKEMKRKLLELEQQRPFAACV